MKRVVLFVALLAGAGCSMRPMTLTSKYQAIGRYGGGQPGGHRVPASAVEVFVQAAPEGFTLEKNELSVLAGYDHKVLGTVRVVTEGGFCDISSVAMKDAVALLQAETAARGGNAVIYVESKLSDPSTESERCNRGSYGPDNHFAAGWAVIRSTGTAPAVAAPGEQPVAKDGAVVAAPAVEATRAAESAPAAN